LNCGGHGELACSCGNGIVSCGCGNGREECQSCDYHGKVSCTCCGGSCVQVLHNGQQRCGACYGHGKTNCNYCGGLAQVNCRHCGGSTTLTCSNCGGSAKLSCSTCQEKGFVNCSKCSGTGHKSTVYHIDTFLESSLQDSQLHSLLDNDQLSKENDYFKEFITNHLIHNKLGIPAVEIQSYEAGSLELISTDSLKVYECDVTYNNQKDKSSKVITIFVIVGPNGSLIFNEGLDELLEYDMEQATALYSEKSFSEKLKWKTLTSMIMAGTYIERLADQRK